MSDYCALAPNHPVHAFYHDQEYGFPVMNESALFERLALEIFQAGLSWEIVLKKRSFIKEAFSQFVVDKVAAYDEVEIERLLKDARIIRNNQKIRAIIHNAQQVMELRRRHNGFAQWLKLNAPREKNEWVALFKKEFAFMGKEIVGEFLMSIGVVPGAHQPECPVYLTLAQAPSPWPLERTKA
jgi:DNA-3-methyladenine glycosylase I